MSWFKIDDGFWSHPKVASLSPEAVALWVRAGSWCSQHLTDGVVPAHMLHMFLSTPSVADQLVSVGLWEMDESGYVFHDWSTYQRSRADVTAERDAARERQRKGREQQKSRRESRTRHAVTDAVTSPGSHGGPDPTRPDQVTTDVVTLPAVDESFDAFYSNYPRKVGKQAAVRAWAKAIKTASADRIIEGTRRFAADPNLPAGSEAGFIPHPATWLARGSWDDDPLPPRRGTTGQARQAEAIDLVTRYQQKEQEHEAVGNRKDRRLGAGSGWTRDQ